MGMRTLHGNLRAAFRERLLTLTQLSEAPGVSVTLTDGVFTRASGSWIDAGFEPGQEVTVNGFAGSPLYGQVISVTALGLRTDLAGAETVSGGGEFVVDLPQGRAWEGKDYNPVSDRAYVSETLQTVSQRGVSIGNANGAGGTIETKLIATASFFYPRNRGTIAIEGMAGAALVLFRRGQSLSRNGDAATIENVSRSSLYNDGARIGCAVSVNLLAYTQD